MNAVADALSLGVLVTDGGGGVVWANAALHGMGMPAEDPVSALPLDTVEPGSGRHEIAWVRPDGENRWLEISCKRLDDAPTGGGMRPRLLYEIADITERHEELARARNREWRLSRIEALARVGTWEWDILSGDVTWSDQLLKTFGYSPGTELDYAGYRSLLHPDDVHIIEDTLAEALETAGPFTYTHRMYLADRQTLRIFECYGEVFTDAVGRPVRILGTAHDITDKMRTQEKLAYLADHDPLTGLSNRRVVTERLRERLACLNEEAHGLGALLLIDLDNFKHINDVRGHAVGDHVMRSVAELLAARVDEGVALGRLGGDEFAIVLPDAAPQHALDVAEGLCDALSRTPVVANGIELRITSSIGVAPLAGGCERDTLLARADRALYEAKAAGRNRARLFAAEEI